MPLLLVFPKVGWLYNKMKCRKTEESSEEIWAIKDLPSLIRARKQELYLDQYLNRNSINLKEDQSNAKLWSISQDDINDVEKTRERPKDPFLQLGIGILAMFRLQLFLLTVFLAMAVLMLSVGITYYINGNDKLH